MCTCTIMYVGVVYIVHVGVINRNCIAHVQVQPLCSNSCRGDEGLRIHVCPYIVYSHVNVYILLYK